MAAAVVIEELRPVASEQSKMAPCSGSVAVGSGKMAAGSIVGSGVGEEAGKSSKRAEPRMKAVADAQP